VQDVDQDEPRRLAGADGARSPYWSPDSASIAYVAERELRRISVQRGASGVICPLPGPLFAEGTWSLDGEAIVFNSGRINGLSLSETASQGGTPEEMIMTADVSETATTASEPRFVQGAASPILLFTAGTRSGLKMYVKNLDTGQTAALGPGDRPVYSAAGHLIYQSDRGVYDLWDRPFSPDTPQFTGSDFPPRQNARQPSGSNDGTMAYLDGTAAGAQTLVWLSCIGEVLDAIDQPQPNIDQPSLSPDGQRVAVKSSESGNDDIWVHDLTRSTKTRMTFDAPDERQPG
jgi:Tol biopolymer transport system component